MENFDYKKYTWIAGGVALICTAFASFAFGLASMDSLKHPTGQAATISVSGEGETTAIPDIATITFTVRESAKTVPEAQKLAEAKVIKAIAAVSALGVDKKDQKTLSYTVNPKYDPCHSYSSANGTVLSLPCVNPLVDGQLKIIGYEITETIQAKVRKIDSAGEVLGALGTANVTEISGPEFTVDNMEKVEADAKALAIKDAKEKAKITAKALGVDLGEITQFSEDNGGYYPMMYSKAATSPSAAADAVSIPQGENVIKSHVTITYSLD